jgi:hypothetical protein
MGSGQADTERHSADQERHPIRCLAITVRAEPRGNHPDARRARRARGSAHRRRALGATAGLPLGANRPYGDRHSDTHAESDRSPWAATFHAGTDHPQARRAVQGIRRGQGTRSRAF